MKNKVLLIFVMTLSIFTAHSQWVEIPSGVTGKLDAFHFFDSSHGFCSGGFTTILETTDGGATWASTTGIATRDFSFYNDDIGYGAASVIGSMHKTTNGGDSWTSITPPTTNSLWSVGIIDANTAFYGGTGGVLWKTDDGGGSVTVEDADIGVADPITDIIFTSTSIGYLVVQNGEVKKTTNGGDSWTTSYELDGSRFSEMVFVDANLGYVAASAGQVLKTENAGASWTVLETGSTSSFQGIDFFDADHGIVVGLFGKILYTFDGGDTWLDQPSGVTAPLYDVRMLSASSAIVCGNEGIILKNEDLLSIPKNALETQIEMYPIPMDDHLIISGMAEIKSIWITNMLGIVVWQDFQLKSADGLTIYPNLESGAYIISIEAEGTVLNRRFIRN